MKVLVISHMYPSEFDEMNGIFVHYQVKALVEKGIKVQVVSPVPWAPFPFNYLSFKWKSYSNIPEQTVYGGINLWYPRYLTFPRAWFFASSGQRMYRGIKDVVKKIYQEFPFDLIHAHVVLPDGFAATKIKCIYHKPMIITIHGQDLYATINKNNNCKVAMNSVFKKADKIITVSSKLKKMAANGIGFNDKIMVIGNGVPFKKIIAEENNLLSGRIANSKIILSASSLFHRKGIYFNLRAFSKLVDKYPNLKYQIIGDGPEKNYLKKIAFDLGINNQVDFLGKLSHENVLSYMAKADIFSVPSWNEGFGVVYIEAMALGKPVIGCRGEGIEDFVEHKKTGMLVKPKNTDSLVEALDFLLSYPDEARVIGEKARSLVLENYTWEKNAGKMLEVYQEVLNNAR